MYRNYRERLKIKYEKGCKGAHGVSLADWIERVKPVLEVAKEDATTKLRGKKPKGPNQPVAVLLLKQLDVEPWKICQSKCCHHFTIGLVLKQTSSSVHQKT